MLILHPYNQFFLVELNNSPAFHTRALWLIFVMDRFPQIQTNFSPYSSKLLHFATFWLVLPLSDTSIGIGEGICVRMLIT